MIVLAVSDAGARRPVADEQRDVPVPAAGRSMAPGLVEAPGLGLVLTWLEETPGAARRLRMARWQGGAWVDPRTVVEDDALYFNHADVPGVWARADGRLVAHWLKRSSDAPYAYEVRVSRSDGYHAPFADPVVPHGDRSPVQHGFVSIVARTDGSDAVWWLDGRHGELGDVDLRASVVAPDGAPGDDRVVDASTCSCCRIQAVSLRDEIFLVYRDRTVGEVRDIVVGRHVADGAVEIVRRFDDGWVIPGCPLNGPAALARGEALVVGRFTAAQGRPRVLLTLTEPGLARDEFSVRLDQGHPLGNVDVALTDDGIVASWVEQRGEGDVILLRHVGFDGAMGPVVAIDASREDAVAGHPRLAVLGRDVLVAWTDASRRRVRVSVLSSNILDRVNR